jgi:hypothetical protein
LDLAGDIGNNDWNNVYWNNNFKPGFGIRLKHEYTHECTKIKDSECTAKQPKIEAGDSFLWWFNNVNVSIFYEHLGIENSLDNAKDEILNNISSTNERMGLEVWLSVDSKKYGKPIFWGSPSLWGEMWGEYAYNTTNFSDEGKEDFHILTLQPKIGLKWSLTNSFSFQPYYGLDINKDFGSSSWNDEPWLNNIQHHFGIRFSFSNFEKSRFEGATIRFYAEYLSIELFSKR